MIMKKKILVVLMPFLFVTILFFSCSNSSKVFKKTDLKTHSLRANVKILDEKKYKTSNDNQNYKLESHIIFKFNELGNYSDIFQYYIPEFGMENIDYQQIYYYDKNINIDKVDFIDKAGNLIKCQYYVYDEKNILDRINVKNTNNRLLYFDKYIFNDKGITTEVSTFDNNEVLVKTTSWKHDLNGNETEMDFKNYQQPSDNVLFIHKYDEKNRCVESIFRGNMGEFSVYIVYNESNDEIEKKYVFPDNPKINNNIFIEYEYDNKDNWIKQVEKSNNSTIVTIREITYF